ncbi:hypothetical protein LPW26_06075 [Rhodopseudomonas sp. HC1]|uniref:hypothetical protein n=1 Tax=Rhodopseudomonas infernalis TaxID=2897386 RepID=UPI001EE835D7|nr:hypothetical protein [Rhodopseudomonas infernalis]MCG6204194.1 hypothetical protein [Rhodopseudomonas infernalis]
MRLILMTPFERAAAKASRAIDRVHGETFLFEAFTVGADVDLPKVADPSRPSFMAVAAWHNATSSITPKARGSVQDDNAHAWTLGQPFVTVNDAGLQWRPRPGDRITRAKTGAVYEITKPPRPDGVARTTIPLTDRKR